MSTTPRPGEATIEDYIAAHNAGEAAWQKFIDGVRGGNSASKEGPSKFPDFNSVWSSTTYAERQAGAVEDLLDLADLSGWREHDDDGEDDGSIEFIDEDFNEMAMIAGIHFADIDTHRLVARAIAWQCEMVGSASLQSLEDSCPAFHMLSAEDRGGVIGNLHNLGICHGEVIDGGSEMVITTDYRLA
jgi:hypothetical protein